MHSFLFTLYLLVTITIFPLSLKAELADDNSGPYPNPDRGYVTDLVHLLSPEEEELIEQWLWQVEVKKGIEIILFTINSIYDYPGTDNRSIESFSRGLFDQYHIGNLPKNDGVLFLMAKNDRKARIELGAYYGFQKDTTAKRIMNLLVIPEFKKGEYSRGIMKGVKAIMWEFARMYPFNRKHIIFCLLVLCFLMLLAYNLFRQGKKGWGWAILGILVAFIIWMLLILEKISQYMAKDSSDHWESGGFGGGFGGGYSGGGGATGSW